ncbi:hypothetical protein [Roseicyclus marinus]|uniref:hypothetical protein n=1 Tax=Roseicyclus marinus TaxID=2161673 RepID=UPI0024107624|nr:hypothetical protein [Roseicyclus marinus]MDG3042316.1 hypothetical protein [Roseicyclus marinus]
MTVEFALFLSPEGIALAHRQQAGHWALVAEARPEGDDLGAAMAELRGAAEARGGGDAPVVLVLPDDQVLYTSFMAPTHDAELVAARITEALDGLTPYAVEDLVHDWRAVEEDRVKVAVVARETLDEARDFALSHGFTTAGFAAMPPAERFPAMPVFGDSAAALGMDPGGMAFGSDDWTPPESSPEVEAETPEAEARDDAEAEGEAEAASTSGPETAPEAGAGPDAEADADAGAKAADSTPDDAAADAGEAAAKAKAEVAPEVPAEDAALGETGPRDAEGRDAPDAADLAEAAKEAGEPEAGADAAAEQDARPVAQAAEPEADVAAEAKPDAAPLAEEVAAEPAPEVKAADPTPTDEGVEETPDPIVDPTLNQPITPLAAEPDLPLPDAADEPTPESERDAAPEQDPEPLPQPKAAKETAPADSPEGKAARGKGEGRMQRPLSAERPDGAAARPAAGPSLSTAPEGAAETGEDGSEGGSGPVLGFAARRGKVPKPDAGAGDLLSGRPSRLGFGSAGTGTGTGTTPPVLHPDATVGPATPAPVRPGHRLAAQLARVRDASKLSGQSGAVQASDAAFTPAPASRATAAPAAPVDAAAPAAAPAKRGTPISARLGLSRRRQAETDTTQTPTHTPTPGGDSAAAFSSGLLARKPVDSAGPSFKTGLILTVILLVLLALIAIWSALFLPDSPIARLLGGGNEREDVVLVDPPRDTLAPPMAITAPPAMGALDTGTALPEDAAETLAQAAEVLPEAVPADTETGTLETAALEAPLAEGVVDAGPDAPSVPVLPDIDADLDLPPLPPLPEDMLPSVEETERIYAEDGIWPRTPDRPTLGSLSTSNEIYVASIDPEVPVTDAIALADPALDPGEILRRVPPPPPFGVTPDRDASGLVTPTPEGVLTPEGAFVILGRPAVDAIPRPREIVFETVPDLPQIDVQDAILGTVQPTPRPSDLDETRERQILGGFSASELAALRPEARPVSAQEAAAQASLFPQGADGAAEVAETTPEAAPAVVDATALAVASSRLPRARPGNIEEMVAAAVVAAPAVPQEAIARAPSIPSNADVTRAATERNAIRLRDINLIGVTGTPNDRRALVRLPSGRFVRVAVGDRLDGGRVAAIGETSLQYVRNGRNVTLEIPG